MIMTKSEVLERFKILIDKNADISFGGYPAFLDSEIEVFLDQAMHEVISNKYTGTQNQVGFEGSDKRISDLKNLIGTALLLTAKDTRISNAVAFKLPDDFWFYVDSYAKINGNKVYQVELTTHDIAKNFAVTYDNDPYIPIAKAVIEDNSLIVYYDTHIVNSLDALALNYIYRPVLFIDNKTDEGLELMLDEIINRAVLIALENIEAPRTETKLQLNSLQE